jgi:hypothetical protein
MSGSRAQVKRSLALLYSVRVSQIMKSGGKSQQIFEAWFKLRMHIKESKYVRWDSLFGAHDDSTGCRDDGLKISNYFSKMSL